MTEPFRILLIHSKPELSKNLQRILQEGGYELKVCSGVGEGIRVLKNDIWHFVLLDAALDADAQEQLSDFIHEFCPDSLVMPVPRYAAADASREIPVSPSHTKADGINNFKALKMAIDRMSQCMSGRDGAKRSRSNALNMAKEFQESNLRLMEMDRRKNSCLAVATHELRTPITIVSGYLRLLLSESFGALNDKQKHLLRESHKNCNRLITLVNSMLDRCRLESGSVEFDYRREGYFAYLQKVAVQLKDYVEESGLTLMVDLPKEEVRLDFDPDAIEQALVNLIGNAVKFTRPPGKITLRCETAPEGVLTQVIDTGVGIEGDDIDKVFDEFNRVGRRHGDKKGAGLGLSICKKIIHAHRGDIWVKSQVGEGSCFSFLLPT